MNRADAAGEVLVPFPFARARVPMATHIRSTMITSSLSTLKALGLFDAYVANLTQVHRDVLPMTVAGFWLPIEQGIAHYEACDKLRLLPNELLSMGEGVGIQSQESALSLALKLAAGSGVTPWTVLSQSRRFWDRAFKGSGVAVFKLGPKEARFEIVGWPLARIDYNRISFRGILVSLARPFCTKVYVTEIAGYTSTTVSYRVAWA